MNLNKSPVYGINYPPQRPAYFPLNIWLKQLKYVVCLRNR